MLRANDTPSMTRLAKFCTCVFAIMLTACATPPPFEPTAIERKIISVSQWGGTPADATKARLHTISRITLHHQGETFARGRDPQQYLRNLQSWSRNTRKWLDIPYHYVIDLDGNIYQARDIRFAGDTNTEYDPAGHALIEVVGNFEEIEPNPSQLAAVADLMTMLAQKYSVPPEAIRSHRDYSTATVCPGKNLYRYLEEGYFHERVRANLAGMKKSLN